MPARERKAVDQSHPMKEPWHHLNLKPNSQAHTPEPYDELIGGKRLCKHCDGELATDRVGNPVTPDKNEDI
jgi:hypothetical protein